MTDVLHHGFVSPRGDGADPTQIQPSHWNTGHKFQGGNTGEVLTREATDATYGAKWAKAGLITPVNSSPVGTVHNWNPGFLPGSAAHYIQWGGASDVTITGLAGGTPGHVAYLKNAGSAVMYLSHGASGSSAAPNTFYNMCQNAKTPLAPQGYATYVHNGAVWVMVAHDQGVWIVPAYSAANFTAQAGTWTVEAGDIQTYAYRLAGRHMTLAYFLATTSVSAVAADLRITIPDGFTSTRVMQAIGQARDAGGAYVAAPARVTGSTIIYLWSSMAYGSWAVAAGNTDVIGEITFEVN